MAHPTSSTATEASIRTNRLNLQKLLSHLQAALPPLSPTHRAHPATKPTTWHERARLGSNLQHARSLLLQLEQQTQTRTEKAPSWRQQTGTGVEGLSAGELQLREKRVLIRKLNQRFRELEQRDEAREDSDEGVVEGQDLLAEYGIVDQMDGRRAAVRTNHLAVPGPESQLRSRGTGLSPPDHEDTGTSTGISSDANPAESSSETNTRTVAGADTDTLLTANRREQESLTESLVEMAQRLRAGATQFGRALEEERSIVGRAVAGLDRNSTGLEAAGRFMKSLTRQTEGKGWFGRMKLYLIVAVEIVLVLFVLLLPKLRF